MAGHFGNTVLDFGLDGGLKQRADRLLALTAEATTYAQATTLFDGTANKYMLGAVAIDSTDITVADGASRREATVSAQSGPAGAFTGGSQSAEWWALVDDTASDLLCCFPMLAPYQAVNASGTINWSSGKAFLNKNT